MITEIENKTIPSARYLQDCNVHPSWVPCLLSALQAMNQDYLATLFSHKDWLPGHNKIFNAFSLPLTEVNYILMGESPYPRVQSANGYAFWDASVDELWTATGMSKQVNRATSLRNMIKMLLVGENLLQPEVTTQDNIAALNKSELVQTNDEFFHNFLKHGFLLLNATLVLNKASTVKNEAQAWIPFLEKVFTHLAQINPNIKLILFGNIAKSLQKLLTDLPFDKLISEHPYNISFITNSRVLEFFKPLHLLTSNSSQR